MSYTTKTTTTTTTTNTRPSVTMSRTHIVLVHTLLATILFFQPCTSFCPAKCLCDNDPNLRVQCISAGLDEVPIQFNPDVKNINLTLNQIETISYTLVFYTSLETLDLSRNSIRSLGSKNFESQKELRTLNLSRNFVTHLGREAFHGLKNLQILDLSFNNIEMVNRNALSDLQNLTVLDLRNNNMLSMEKEIFQHLISLERLVFQNNQLLDIPSNNLMHLKSLKQLDMSGNLIATITNASFDGLEKLAVLKLGGNVIDDIDLNAFDGLTSLRSLDLSYNNLTMVPTRQLSKLSNLTYLSLSGNSFDTVPAVALLNLFHLRELHLNRLNHLVRIDSRAFVDNTNLQIITMDNNPEFSELPPKLFHGNPSLLEISMRANNLHTIDAAHFPLDQLHRLYLGDNPFMCNCSLLWLWRLVTGQYEERELHTTNLTNVLVLDKNFIGCDIYEETKHRRLLRNMSEGEIRCPAHLVTIVCGVMSVLVVVLAGASVLFYMRMVRRKRKMLEERKNVNERIVPQQVDKLELERYLAAQALANEYRALRPWDMPPIKEPIDENDHYEKFDDFQYGNQRINKPHVVYV